MVEILGILEPEVNYFVFDFNFFGPTFLGSKLFPLNLATYCFLINSECSTLDGTVGACKNDFASEKNIGIGIRQF